MLATHNVALLRSIEADPLVVATALNNLGTRLLDLERLVDGEKKIREALAIEEGRLAPDDPSLAGTLSNLAGIHRDKKEFAKAALIYKRVAKINKARKGKKSSEYAMSLSNLGTVYGLWWRETAERGRLRQARRCFTVALTITQAARGERHPETATRHHNLATLKWERGDRPGAIAEAERALAIRLSLDLMLHQDTHRAAGNLIQYLQQSGHHEKAEKLLRDDISDLLSVIVEVEAEHLAWVTENSESRDFGPPSRFAVGQS
jgi:tetratricopeptide (TPR) repeat protein